MKRILYIIALLISANSFGQYPLTNNLGSDSTLVNSKGATKSRFINVVYADTTAANLDRIKAYPGAQIFTSTGNVVWIRNSTATRWILQSSGAASVTQFSAGNLSPLFTTSVLNATTAPALSFAQSNVSPNTYFGRLSGTGVPSFIANSDMVIPCSPSATQLSPTQIEICLCPGGACDTLTVAGGINNFYFINDTTIVVGGTVTLVCDTIFNADPTLAIDSIICIKVQSLDTIILGGGFNTTGYVFQNGLQQVSPWVIEQGGFFNRNTSISGRGLFNFRYDSLNFTVRGPFGTGQPIDTLFGPQMSFLPRKGAFIAGTFLTFGNVGQSDTDVGPFTTILGVNNKVPGNYSYASGISNYVPGYVNTVSGENNQVLGNRSFVTGQSHTLNANSYNSAMIGGFTNLAYNHYGLTAGYYNQNYTYAGTVLGVYNDTIHSKARQALGFNSTYDVQGEGLSVGNGTGVGALRSNSLTLFNGGNLVIGGATYQVGASIDLPNPEKAFAINRGTTAQMNAVPSPYDGMLYENSDSLALMEYWASLGGWMKVDRSGGGGGGSGTVTSIVSGNGMNFSTITTTGTVTLGTPSSVTLASTNSLTATSHTHAFAPGGTTGQYIRGDGSLATFPASSTYYNSNVGSGYRLVIPNTNNIKTLFATYPLAIDSATSNALTFTLDTTSGKWRSENYYKTIFESALTFSTGLTRTGNTITGNLSTGIAGSQTMYGGTAANEDLTIEGTVHATKTTSYVAIQPSGGSVSIGASTAAASSILDMTSTTQGVLTPRMTGAQMTSISSPAAGLLIYNTDSVAFCYYSGSAWLKIGIGGGGGGVGTVTSVASGNGMNFSTITGSGTVTMGTPSSVTLASTNSTSATSHTHAFAPGGTTAQYIRGDGSLATTPLGTVTSVDVSGGTTGLTTSGGPITSSGTIVLAGTLITSNGGTGLTSWTQGDIPYYTSGFTLSKLAKSTTANQFLSNGGTNNAPSWASITASMIGSGAALTVVDDTNIDLSVSAGGATALLTAASVTATWAGTLAATRGGTGTNTVTTGDVLYGSSANVWSKLPIGTVGQFLKVSAGGIPEWGAGGGGSTSPGGSDQNIQYNNAGSFGGISTVNFDGSSFIVNSGVLKATRPKFITSVDDTNGNELFKVTATASAVNEITIANAATGTNPSITATGGDANNIGLDVILKTGASANASLNIKNSDNAWAGSVRIFENGANGTNSFSVSAAGSMASTDDYVWPSAKPTGNGQILTGDLNGVMYWTDPGGTPGISVPINHLINATGDNSLTMGDYNQVWNADGLTDGFGIHITSTSSANTGDNFAFGASTQGNNSVSGVKSYAAFFAASKTGTSSTNIGLGIDVLAGTNNFALVTYRGRTGINNDNPTAPLTLGTGPLGTSASPTPINAQMDWYGSTSGVISIKTSAIAGTWTWTLPANDGSNGDVLTTDGTGFTYWSPASGGSITLAAIGSTPNANAATLTGTVLNLEPADATYGGVVKSGAQTFPTGIKTFQSDIIVNGFKIGLAGGQIASNIAIGNNTLLFNSTGSDNLAVGNGAMFFNTSGFENTAIGKESLYQNTVGAGNTALGISAARENTGGDNNTAIGYGALQNNTNGIENVAVGGGAGAGGSGNFASYNTSVGYAALRVVTTGEQNAAFGKNALFSMTTGIKNTAIGAAAMEETTTGYQNVAVGMDAMLHNSTGWGNIGIGWLGGSLNETGDGNIHMGWSAGRNVKNGNENISIGFSAMYLDLGGANSQLEGASNSIAIGAYTYTTADNQIVIGNANHTATYLRGAIFFNGSAGTTGQILTSQGSSAAPIWTSIGAGTVTSVAAGAGMNFTTITGSGSVVMGTPSDVTLLSTNSASGTTHTHAFAPGGTSSQVVLGNATLGTYYGAFTFTDGSGFDGTVTGGNNLSLTTTLTLGSVFFTGASGAINEDNTNFFWDNSNNRLGIGLNTPDYQLDVRGSINELQIGNFYNSSIVGQGVFVKIENEGGYDILRLSSSTNDVFIVRGDGSVLFNNSAGVAGQILQSSGVGNPAGWSSNLVGIRIYNRAPSTAQSATPTIDTDVTDVVHITGLAQAITSMTTNLTGTPAEGDELRIDITDNGTGRAITWGSAFENGAVTLPTTTVASTRLDMWFWWNSVTSKWRIMLKSY